MISLFRVHFEHLRESLKNLEVDETHKEHGRSLFFPLKDKSNNNEEKEKEKEQRCGGCSIL